jgi:hypothetical protein
MNTEFRTDADRENDFAPDLNNVFPKTHSARKPRGKPFAPGNREGKGRPRGSRNKTALLLQGMIDEYSPALIRKLLKMALEGDRTALKLMAERTVAPLRDDRVCLRMPPVRSAADLTTAAAAVIDAASQGKVSIEHAKSLMDLLQGFRGLTNTEDHERRLVLLEQCGSASRSGSGLEEVDPAAESIAEPDEETTDGV